MIGDIVGKPGREAVIRSAAGLRIEHRLDLLLANAENAAAGSGITPAIYRQLVGAGIDGITLGDHIYRRREINPILESQPNIVKPANFPTAAPGSNWMRIETADGTPVVIISLLGRLFMRPTDCPWTAVDRVLNEIADDIKIILVDFHAEATSEKQVMGRHLDGRVSAVVGTHTHVPTADTCVLPGGTAFQCDLGMTGPHDSILGRRIDRVTETTITFNPTQFEVATGDVRINGAILDIDAATGRANNIERLEVREADFDRLAELGKPAST